MVKNVLLGLVVLVVLAAAGAFFWARSILATDTVRTAIAAQVSSAIGQPVSIASIDASIYPRVTVNLGDVRIGEPARIRVQTLRVGTEFRALLSRQIAHATLRLDGAHIQLPLPPLLTQPSGASASPSAPVEIVSIDEIVLKDVEVVSGGHTLRADIDAVPEGKGFVLRRMSVRADDTAIEGSGKIVDAAGLAGELALKAKTLNLERLLAFAADFAGGATSSGPRAPAHGPSKAQPAPAMNLAVALDANRATIGTLTLDRLSGRAHVTPRDVTLDPITFGLFHGRYEGTMVLTLGETPDFHLKAALSNVDVAEATKFAGSPNTITGKLAGKIDLSGHGTDAAAVTRSARGTVRVDIRDGVVNNLGLLRAVVLATSMKADWQRQINSGSKEEPFTQLGATLRIANGAATTDDLRFESRDLGLDATGSLGLTGNPVDLKGKIQLSEALSQQAGRDLVRYTQEQGRVTLPATVTGSVSNLSTRIDVQDVAVRALKNRAAEEAQKAIKNRLGGLFK